MLASSSAGPALATFPGANDKIAWTSVVDVGTPEARTAIFVDTVPLTNPIPGENHRNPSWSRDGSKLVFTSHSPSGHQIEIINADGSGRQVVVNLTLLGLPTPYSPVWDPNGTRIVFRLTGFPVNSERVYSVNVDGTGLLYHDGITVVGDIDIKSPIGLVWKQQSFVTPAPNQLAWNSQVGLQTGLIQVEIPDQLGIPSVSSPVWMADGNAIVFRAVYSILENGVATVRSEWFKIRRDGTGLKQLTEARDICPAAGLQPDFSFGSAAPSPDGDLIVLVGTLSTVESFNGTSCSFRSTNGLWSIPSDGGHPGLVHEDPHAQGRPSWQPNPASLVVKIDDGRDNPLEGLKLALYDATAPAGSAPLNVVAENTIGGSYGFDLPFGTYRLRATLVVDDGFAAFDIRNRFGPDEAVWLEKTIIHQFGMPVPRFSFDSTAGNSNVPEDERDYLDDLAHIYFRLKQYVDWVRATLTPVTGESVRVYARATTDLDGYEVLPAGAHYNGIRKAIFLGTATSSYADRDGTAQAESPENGEWHEFTHHLITTFISNVACPGINHGGYHNPDTCDSMHEGLGAMLPALAAHAIDGASDADYDSKGNIERDLKAWDSKVNLRSKEPLAVAALLWDLVDLNADVESSQVIGVDGLHHPVTYQDTMSLPVEELWERIASLATITPTVYDLRRSFDPVVPTRDLDGDGVADVAPIDEVFLMHGFFPIQGDQQQTPTHETYHFRVNAEPDNDHVGRTDHEYRLTDGTVTSSTGPRPRFPAEPQADIEVRARDTSGTPLAGATVRLRIDDDGQQHTMERRLGDGESSLVHLELPAYFSYLLPADAPGLPPCDPVNDTRVEVVVTASINDYESADSFTFDNCTYWHAIADASGPAALSFTLTFPEDVTPPVSEVFALASVPSAGDETWGYWRVELSCSDPVSAGFASGCHRTEYRINGGPLTLYRGSFELVGLGEYVVEFRSLDAAANEELFQSATYHVMLPPDTDGDGLNDAEELALGTNPNSSDTDGDGLSDGGEVGLGTNPLVADTDGDGLNDGFETARGLDPLDPDGDDDGTLDGPDRCRTVYNPVQRDSDGDGFGEVCDNCPQASNSNQADTDGDGAGDVCDCAPADPSKRRPASPSVLASKTGGATIVLSWMTVAGADTYSVMRGDLAGLAANDFGACLGNSGAMTTFSDPELPASGGLFVYLVQGQSYTCGIGSLGFGANEVLRVNLDAQACGPATLVERLTVSDTHVSGILIAGTHLDTHTANHQAQSIGEQQSSGGSPSTRHGFLEHRWVFDVAPGDVIELLVQGERSEPADGDDVRFEWSTNGTTFTPIPMGSLQFLYDFTVVTGPLPASLSGPVTIRVVDTVRTPGTDAFDWVWIDRLAVRSITF